MKKVLLVASNGGHWEQLMTMKSAFQQCECYYACTDVSQAEVNEIKEINPIPDVNRNKPLTFFQSLRCSISIINSIRPDVIITTGAAPGLVMILTGKVFSIKTLWIDSIANVEKMSLSGRIASHIADKTISQWKHVADTNKRVEYWGGII